MLRPCDWGSLRMYHRLRTLHFVERHPTIVFWLSFGALNLFLFLPRYLFARETSSLVPPTSIFTDGAWMAANRLFIWRGNLDPFRISIELTLLVGLWVSLRWIRVRPYRWLVTGFYLLALAYAIYEAIVMSVWRLEPVFYSQYYLARDGLPFLLDHLRTSWWQGLALIAVLAVAAFVVSLIVSLMLDSSARPTFPLASRVLMAAAAVWCVFAASTYQVYTARSEAVPASLAFKIKRNITDSVRLHTDIMNFDDGVVQRAYDYSPHDLAWKPDIFFIFVESYGSVLYKRPDYRRQYAALLSDVEKSLDDAGWHEASALSESPTWGGGSWLAYTSTLMGLKIASHPQYLSLLNKYQVEPYPNLGRTLKDQGYRFVWISALDDAWSDISWAKLERFYGADDVFRQPDFEYTGPGYGWGPAPPDQYMLNYAFDNLLRTDDRPTLLFTITQNSHYPWMPLPSTADDWHTLNDLPNDQQAFDDSTIEHGTRRSNYFRAVEYQFDTLKQLILDHGDDNSVFVLIGDHQPPMVSRDEDGWATPVHIISRDKAFIESLGAYGLAVGLKVSSTEAALRHEGIYSMLMRALYQRSGVPTTALPTYLPDGAVQTQEPQTASQTVDVSN